jgi:DUF1680 family protein
MRFFKIKRSDVKYSGMMLKEKAFSNREYLMSLDSEALLFNFKTEAVLDDPFIQNRVKLHGGWESPTCQLRGHFLGYWLSAAAFYYAATGDIGRIYALHPYIQWATSPIQFIFLWETRRPVR